MKINLNFQSSFYSVLKFLQVVQFSFLNLFFFYGVLSLIAHRTEAAVRDEGQVPPVTQGRLRGGIGGGSTPKISYGELEKIEILPESAFVNTGRDRLGGGSYSSGIFRRVIPEVPGVPPIEELWIGKADYRRTVEETESVSVGEVLASRFYELFIERPKTTLSLQKYTNTGNPEDEGKRYAVHVMVKLMEGFYPYSHQVGFDRQRPNPNGKIYHPEGENVVELEEEGHGRASAVASLIKHWDYRGASSTNMGYRIVDLPEKGRIARSIVIDSGGAFDTNPAISLLPRHVRFAPQGEADMISFEEFPPTTRHEFLMTLHTILSTEEADDEVREALNERKIARLFMTEGAEYFVLRDGRSVENLTTLLLNRQRQLREEYAPELVQTKEAYLELRARQHAEQEDERERQERIQREEAERQQRESQLREAQQNRLRDQLNEISRVLGVQAPLSLPLDPLQVEKDALHQFKRDYPQDQARARSHVREMIKREGPHREEAALTLFLKGSTSDQLLSRPLLRTLLDQRDTPQKQEAALVLFLNGNTEDQRLSRPILLGMISDSTNLSRYEAAQILFDRGGEGDRREARANVRDVVEQHQAHPAFVKSALSLFENGTIEDQTLARRALEPLLGDSHHPNHDQIARAFFFCGTPEDQWRFGKIVRTIAQEESHPRQDEAALALFFKGMPEDKLLSRPILYRVSTDEGHPRQDLATCVLFWNGTEEDQRHARPILHHIVKNPSHPKRDWAARALFETGIAEDQRVSREVLYLVARTEDHPRKELAAWALFERGTAEDQLFAKHFVDSIASNRDHSLQDVALHGLFSKGTEEDRTRFREELRFLAQNETHPRQYEAAKLLVEKGNREDKEIGKDVISRIIQQPGHPLQEKAQAFLGIQRKCLVM